MKRNLFVFIAFVIAGELSGQSIAAYDISACFFPDDASMYGIPVSPENFMRGETVVVVTTGDADSLVFWLHGELRTDSVMIDGKVAAIAREKEFYSRDYCNVATRTVIRGVPSGESFSLKIWYSGFFNPSRVRSLSDYMRINVNEGVFLRSYGYSLWFPVFIDDSGSRSVCDFRSVTVDLPENFRSVVTGDLVREYIDNGRSVSVWHPGVTDIFEIQCTAAPFRVEERNGIRVYFTGSEAAASEVLNYVADLRDFCHKRLRAYADDRIFYIMEMPEYGNISSGNVIGLDYESFQSFSGMTWPKSIIAHELVHPYVQLPLDKDNPFYAIFTEGMPSFFQVYLLDGTLPPDQYNREEIIRRVERSYLSKRESGLDSRGNRLPQEKALLDIDAQEIGSYKDTFILNDRMWLFMYDLWTRMGDEQFSRFCRELFALEDIDYRTFDSLITGYLPGYSERLHQWISTTLYTDDMRL